MQEFETDKIAIEQFKEHIKLQCGSNKSKTYILPMLASSTFKYSTDIYNSNLRGVFIGDSSDQAKYSVNKIILLYRFKGDKTFINFENKLINHSLFEHHYEPDKLHTLYVFNVPDEFKADYKLFTEWKISQFSKEYKQQIIDFHRLDSNSIIYKVLHKDLKLKQELEHKIKVRLPEDNELSSMPTWFIEYYQKEFNMKAPKEKMSPSKEFEI